MQTQHYDVVIIGAGPAGSLAASLLHQGGRRVLVLEKEQFPRFSIGESLLPQSMVFLEQAGLLQNVEQHAEQLGFQFKNGAAFHRAGVDTQFDFTEKFTPGPGTTFQVKRALFDKTLADTAQQQGVEIRYQHSVQACQTSSERAQLTVLDTEGVAYQVNAEFVLDASGFGRVLPRLLQLEKSSEFAVRCSFFAHFNDKIDCDVFDRNKILITVHPEHHDIWYWLIPFSDGTASVGVVIDPVHLAGQDLDLCDDILQGYLAQDPNLARLLSQAEQIVPARKIQGYSADVTSLYGPRFALLGNAGEFLDPVFSSGVTIALRSAALIAPLVERYLAGEDVDFEIEYSQALKQGVNCFKTFVKAWYDQRFQDVIFHQQQDDTVKKMISSILAGYAWDESNPYVKQSERRLNVLAELCQSS
ncbi:hypothetical protein PULV_b0430 [Pseudoalteromonas ulvae UL12]|uniref:NAD(P)/FAD-dependent oxidoreductase n=1 Tax=Pseudoalteromonas ulvae TaxID=107327 RepID=UPI00186BAB8C|nr:NAD(P)/FAD-dependent oxidoreductase [Pseudoalteromonas ulvae]MBE0365772.1 hypothetical protein [Pseudoalteromonas ulvae UL12]